MAKVILIIQTPMLRRRHSFLQQQSKGEFEYYLALMYEYGYGGVEKSFDRALQYYQRVAQQNH